MKTRLLALMTLVVFSFQTTAFACTAFRMPVDEGRILIGRNFDWDYGHGLIVLNPRGLAKKAFVLHPSDAVSWTSTYGSLTFNQAGRELPYGGLNEKGLMIEVLWLGYTKWPVTPAPSINEVQWIQYQLDTRASVADLVAHIDDVRIVSAFAKIHYFVCDATGACATIEGRGDHVEVHTGVDMALAALTNDPYSSSVAYAKTFLNQTPPCSSVPTTSDSLARFARAACTSFTTVPGETVIAEAARVNATLDSVAQGTYSKWHVVYDLTAKTISVRTLDAPVAKTVSLGSFDFSCTKSVKILDLNAVFTAPADVSSQFVPYTTAANRSIVERSLLNGFAHMPADVVEKIATFPETMACVAP